MPGLWGRIKVWSSGEILTASDLNAEFNNVISNDVPSQSDDYMANAAQAQIQTDPYPSSVLSLATSLAGELERYRYQMNQIQGTTYWYEDPASDISTLAQRESLGLHIGLEFEGALGGASSTTDVLAKFINQGGLVNAASITSLDVAAGDFDSTNKKFGTYSYILASGNILAFPSRAGNSVKGSLSAWFRNLAANDYIAYNPLLQLECFLSATGLLTWKVTEKTAATESTKNTTTVAGSASRAGDTTFRNVTTKWRLNDENGASTDLMEMEFGGTDEGTQVGTDNIDINTGDGGVWFFGAKRNEPTWDHSYAANGLPSAHSDAWTKTGTFTESVSNGVLNITASALAGNQFYAKSNNIDLDGMTISFKMRINSVSQRLVAAEDRFYIYCRDDSKNRGVALSFSDHSCWLLSPNNGVTNNGHHSEFFFNVREWHTYTITSIASGADIRIRLYVDGVEIDDYINTTADTGASDTILFGKSDAGLTSFNVDVEYFRYESNGSTVFSPVTASSQGNLDSVGVASTVITDSVISRLQNSKVTDVFGTVPSYGVSLPTLALYDRNVANSTSSTTFVQISTFQYHVPGDGVTEFEFFAQLPLVASGASTATHLGIDVDGDISGASVVTEIASFPDGKTLAEVGLARQICVKRLVILPTGLHSIKLMWAVESSTVNKDSASATLFDIGIAKEGKLA